MSKKKQEDNQKPKERPPLPEKPKASTIYETFLLILIRLKNEKSKFT